MTERAPIHVGSGEPILLLHPFMMSQNVWKKVAPAIADTGRYEVYAPTMPGHNGGVKGRFFLDTAELADDMERRMDELGWETAHIVGNSLGGWVAFELERRGRARSLTGIAPAGGWHRWSPAKYEIVFKFVAGLPVYLVAKLLGKRAARLPGPGNWPSSRSAPTRTVSTTTICATSSMTSPTAPPTTSCWSRRCSCRG